MLTFLTLLILTPVVLAGYAASHETGHYLAARLLVRIPPGELRIVLGGIPARLELRAARGGWVRPAQAQAYQDAYARHDRHHRHAVPFLTTGFVLQTAVAMLAAGAARSAGAPGVASWLIVCSVALNVLYIGADLAVSMRARGPAGDISTALTLAPARTGLLITVMVLAHGAWLL